MKSTKIYTHTLMAIICLGISFFMGFWVGFWSWVLVALVFEVVLLSKPKITLDKK
jgi:asparagine N-glycosylation enzyme membrane subunit Stt3